MRCSVSDSSVVSFRSELECIRAKLREGHLNAVREILTDREILSACREVGHEFRDRLLAPVVAVFHVIAAALWPDFSFQASWQVFGAAHVGSGSLAKARGRLPEALFEKLSRFVAGAADRLSESLATWRGHRVVDLDGTCVSMEDNPELKAEFGVPNTRHGPGRHPVARLVAGRWRIETIFRELKVACGADVLRSKTPAGVRKELAARVMAVNLVRSVMIRAAVKHGKEPTRPPFAAAPVGPHRQGMRHPHRPEHGDGSRPHWRTE